ncbi:conserved hypothetical protein [Tenacibaculum sp. 190524A05c]|uniref:hypothetical protein n=1 Tax=Tenacibaculum platacis TaxID=3137852 RepID=UPI0031FA6736
MNKENKYLKLLVGIVFDLIGYTSFIIPWFAEITDVIWAPVSAYLMTRMYKGKKGKVAAVVSFVEEALPWLDIIPTFTLMWIYTYVISSENNDEKKTIGV